MDSTLEWDESWSITTSKPKDELELRKEIEACSDRGSEATVMDKPAKLTSTLPRARTRNSRYYFSLVTFCVGHQLFRVPREGFEMHSKFFRDKFADSQGHQEGDIDDNPIHLEGIDEGAFEDFLQLLYPQFPTKYDSLPLKPSAKQPRHRRSNRLIKILDLAHKWGFRDIRSHAISKLEELELGEVHTTEIAHKYGIESWYMPVYVALARRANPLTIDEAQRLGLDFTVKMGLIREWRLSRRHHSAKKEEEQLKQDIKVIFDLDDSITRSDSYEE